MKELISNYSNKLQTVLVIILPIILVGFWLRSDIRNTYLSFVDAARYADTARSLSLGNGFVIHFTFPLMELKGGPWLNYPPPSYILLLSTLFKLLPPEDMTVIAASSIFFVSLCILVYILAEKLFDKKTALISLIIISFDTIFLSYAKNGGAETFISSLLVLMVLLIRSQRKPAIFTAGILSTIVFFSKIQAPIYLLLPLAYLPLISKNKKAALFLYLIPQIAAFIIIQSGIIKGIPRWGIYWPAFLQNSKLFPNDNLPRSGIPIDASLVFSNVKMVAIKSFYNLYNFIKELNFKDSLPQVANPAVLILGFITLFSKSKDAVIKNYKISLSLSSIVLLFMVSAAVPHVRYFHPLVPFLTILAANTLKEFVGSLSRKAGNAALLFFLMTFSIIPTTGVMVLDSRYNRKIYNTDKPPINYALGKTVGERFPSSANIVTNIDTWTAWYGKINSVLIPITREDFIKMDHSLNTEAIVLTDYQKDNADHPLDNVWADFFENPQNITDPYINNNFVFDSEIKIDSDEVYEKQNYKIVILKRK